MTRPPGMAAVKMVSRSGETPCDHRQAVRYGDQHHVDPVVFVDARVELAQELKAAGRAS